MINAERAELVGHRDFATGNAVFRDMPPVALIVWIRSRRARGEGRRERVGEHGQGDMPAPAGMRALLVLIQACGCRG